MTLAQYIAAGCLLAAFLFILWLDWSDRRAERRAERNFQIDRASRHD